MSETGKSGTSGPADAVGKPAAPAPIPAGSPAQIGIEDFQRLVLRTGIIVAADVHPQADRLLVLKVDIGEAAPRQVVAGIKRDYQPADLVGKRVVVVANMKPALLRGVESQGMVLAASTDTELALVTPERPLPPGSVVK